MRACSPDGRGKLSFQLEEIILGGINARERKELIPELSWGKKKGRLS